MRRMLQEAAALSRPPQTLFEAFLDAVETHGRGRGLVEGLDYREQTYGGLLKTSLAIGRMISKLTAEGENVGVLMPTVGATLALMLGLFAFRRVPAMLNYTAGAESMNSACRAAGVRTVITSRAFLERARLAAAAGSLRDVRLICLEDLRLRFGLADKLWLMRAMLFPRRAVTCGRPEEPAAILFTSGSESKPKGVVLSHASILANVAQLMAAVDCTPADKMLSALPLFHSFGFTIGAVLPAITGCRVVFYPTPLHYRVIPEMIYDRDCTILFAASTFLGNYARFAHPYDLRRLRLLGAGAEKLPDEVRNAFFERFGVRIIEGYGATECSPVIATNTPMAWRAGSVGEAVPGLECRLEPVPGVSEGGLLHVRGPNVMLGYLREESPGVLDPPSSVFGPGWYNTGDIVAIDADGFLRILGRMRRFAKVSGEMVSLEISERIAAAASPGAAHAASTFRDAARGESIVLFTEDANLTREALVEAARNLGSPDVAVPRRIARLEKIPLLGNGKRDYVALDARANAPES
jgi:acyl-[acyl-carrier-protein]-phospholipid O-acyltransferase/long-chain-fatty-acid--[acyl-carrier-protein] ligase